MKQLTELNEQLQKNGLQIPIKVTNFSSQPPTMSTNAGTNQQTHVNEPPPVAGSFEAATFALMGVLDGRKRQKTSIEQ